MQIVPISSISPITPLTPIAETEKAGAVTGKSGGSFSSMLNEAMNNLQETQAVAAQDSYDLAMGNVSDLHSVMIRSGQESIAIETAVALTTRAVSSYKEIMQMQV